MPNIIRHALGERLDRDPAFTRFRRDFEAVTGLAVAFVDDLGGAVDQARASPLCAQVQQVAAGMQMCRRCAGALAESAAERSAQVQCDAGLVELGVPVRPGGRTVGLLVVRGVLPRHPTPGVANDIRHHLERLGGVWFPESLQSWLEATPVWAEQERLDGAVRLLELAAEHWSRWLTEVGSTLEGEKTYPAIVQAACDHARHHFTRETSLRVLAAELGVSLAHLSREFHRATGLRFREYLGRMRAQYARELVEGTDRPIGEIAYAAGFQSMAQFNRVFRQMHGGTPQSLRRVARDRAPPSAKA